MFEKINSDFIVRSSYQSCSIKKGALQNFAKFTENTCARVLFLIKFFIIIIIINLFNLDIKFTIKIIKKPPPKTSLHKNKANRCQLKKIKENKKKKRK